MGVRLAAPAKVNLHLAVLDRRSDGFHDLVSLFQAVDLSDTLRLERTGPDGTVSVLGMPGLPPESNLIARAIEIFRRRAGVTDGVAAAIDKRIPIGAGFGGGSSDAAAALRCLQALFGSPLDGAALDDCARTLGSDVPFFLSGAAAVVEGRGERVRGIAARLDFALVAATPAESVSTAEAFAWLDADRRTGRGSGPLISDPCAVERAYLRTAPESWPFGNSFDETVMDRCAAVRAIRDRMKAAGAAAAHLTGSGSTVIAVFTRREAAAACVRALTADLPPGTLPADVRLLEPLASLGAVEYYG
jgi:4-diphosphocytidyl-2-C-methyl-D-erythritol kinase